VQLSVAEAPGKKDKVKAQCVISRPDQATSYLFFKQYKAVLTGAEGSVDVIGGDRALLRGEHYETAAKDGATVVTGAKGWSGTLRSVQLGA